MCKTLYLCSLYLIMTTAVLFIIFGAIENHCDRKITPLLGNCQYSKYMDADSECRAIMRRLNDVCREYGIECEREPYMAYFQCMRQHDCQIGWRSDEHII